MLLLTCDLEGFNVLSKLSNMKLEKLIQLVEGERLVQTGLENKIILLNI